MKRNKKNLFCNCSHAFDSPLFSNIMIFYLHLFKATKFALIVIDMNRPAPTVPRNRTVPRNQIKGSSSHPLQCSVLIFLQLRMMANCRYNFLRHISFSSLNCKLGPDLFVSITLRANLIALNKFK